MAGKANPHILLVEDESLIALDLEMALEQSDYRVTWCSSVEAALRTLAVDVFDAAVLDMNVNGTMVVPVADELRRLKVPFVVCSGHSRDMLPERHRDVVFITKPYAYRALLTALRATLMMKAG